MERLHPTDITPRYTLLGVVGMIDPPRDKVIASVVDCWRAELWVEMIPGDNATTAAAIGVQTGLKMAQSLNGAHIGALDDAALRSTFVYTEVIARTSLEHKLRLVRALQADGERVLMTGDGATRTNATRKAADLMLCGDNFAPIARAVREGRTVFDNIMKSLRFTLPTNIGQAGAILIALIAGLALAFEPAEPLVNRATGSRIVFFGMLTGMATFGVFDWELARSQSLEAARTAAVNMLAFSEIASLFHVRAHTASALRCTAPCCMTIRLRFG